jgi:hypothetical protein
MRSTLLPDRKTLTYPSISRLAAAAAADPSDFSAAIDELYASIEALRPPSAAPDWLLRPDFDWTAPGRAAAFAEASARKMLMFASSRYLQAMGGSEGPDDRLMSMALNQIEDAEALEVVGEVSRLLCAFAEAWALPEDAPEELATWYTERAIATP